MNDFVLLRSIARSSALAAWLAGDGGGGGGSLRSPPDTDTDTEADVDTGNVNVKQQIQSLEESLHDLQTSFDVRNSDSPQSRRQDGASAVQELATSCRSLCSRVLSTVQTNRGSKRVGTSLNTWKASRPSAGSARLGFELRKLSERLQVLQTNLTVQVGKILR